MSPEGVKQIACIGDAREIAVQLSECFDDFIYSISYASDYPI